MSKIDEVRKAMVEAMKAKDKERKDSLSMLLSALTGCILLLFIDILHPLIIVNGLLKCLLLQF